MSTIITPILPISGPVATLIVDPVALPHPVDQTPPPTPPQAPSPDAAVARSQDEAVAANIATTVRVARLRNEDQALSNVKDALNITATAEALIRTTTAIASRLKELAIQSTSNSLGATERTRVQAEFDALKIELARLTTPAPGDETSGIPAAAEKSISQAVATRDAGDTAIALQASNLTHDVILRQTGESLLAQANQESEAALKLLDENQPPISKPS